MKNNRTPRERAAVGIGLGLWYLIGSILAVGSALGVMFLVTKYPKADSYIIVPVLLVVVTIAYYIKRAIWGKQQ